MALHLEEKGKFIGSTYTLAGQWGEGSGDNAQDETDATKYMEGQLHLPGDWFHDTE